MHLGVNEHFFMPLCLLLKAMLFLCLLSPSLIVQNSTVLISLSPKLYLQSFQASAPKNSHFNPLIWTCIIPNSSSSSSCTVSSVGNSCQFITSNMSLAFAQEAVGTGENLQYTPSVFICFRNWVNLHLVYCSMKEVALFIRQVSCVFIVVSDSHWIHGPLSLFCYLMLLWKSDPFNT